jgi:hypothetical protein
MNESDLRWKGGLAAVRHARRALRCEAPIDRPSSHRGVPEQTNGTSRQDAQPGAALDPERGLGRVEEEVLYALRQLA